MLASPRFLDPLRAFANPLSPVICGNLNSLVVELGLEGGGIYKVAVLKPVTAKRPDNLQQVAAPTVLFNDPNNLFVAGFIGSPAMNMVYGVLDSTDGEVWVSFAGLRMKVAQRALDRHPGLENNMGKQLVVGIRPGDFEAAAVTGPDPTRTLTANVEVAEVLGSETFVHYELHTPPVITPDIEELLADTGADASSLGSTTKFSARVSSDVVIEPGHTANLVIDGSKFHFFDASTGDRIGFRDGNVPWLND